MECYQCTKEGAVVAPDTIPYCVDCGNAAGFIPAFKDGALIKLWDKDDLKNELDKLVLYDQHKGKSYIFEKDNEIIPFPMEQPTTALSDLSDEMAKAKDAMSKELDAATFGIHVIDGINVSNGDTAIIGDPYSQDEYDDEYEEGYEEEIEWIDGDDDDIF